VARANYAEQITGRSLLAGEGGSAAPPQEKTSVKPKTPWFLGLAMLAGLSLSSNASLAQSWPQKPIIFIVPFAAGGGTDAFARPLAAQLD
jgi:hypothetical protein